VKVESTFITFITFLMFSRQNYSHDAMTMSPT
jgi:hypothetical protein